MNPCNKKMQFLKAFTWWMVLLSFASITIASVNRVSVERADSFFVAFDMAVSHKLEAIASEMIEIEHLSEMYSSIVAFPDRACENLFMDVLNGTYDENQIYEQFLVFFNDSIGVEFDQIQRSLYAKGMDWIDHYTRNYASALKDAIVESLKSALDSSKDAMFKVTAEPMDEDYVYVNDALDFQCDQEVEQISNSTPPHLDEDEMKILAEMDKAKSDLRSSSPQPSTDLSLASMTILFYGINPEDRLFNIACMFLQFIGENRLKSVDPASLLGLDNSRLAVMQGFNLYSVAFQEFCNHVSYYAPPITSPLYNGSIISKSKKYQAKRTVLLTLARKNAQKIIEDMNSQEMIKDIQKEHPDVDFGIIELFVERVKDELSAFLCALGVDECITEAMGRTIRQACKDVIDNFGLIQVEGLTETVYQEFMTSFSSPLALIRNYEHMEVWKSHYDENSPTFKETSAVTSPVSVSSTKKSVKIDTEKNEKVVIRRVADIEEDFAVEPSCPVPIRRSPSFTKGLQDLVDVPLFDTYPVPTISESKDKSNSSSCLSIALPTIDDYFEDDACNSRAFDKENMSPFDFDLTVFDEPHPSAPAISTKKYLKDEIPDFPFEDPSLVLEYPEYIRSTGEYFLQHGDSLCFMIDERVATIKGELSTFLSNSFESPEVVNGLKFIIEDIIDSLLKK